MPDPTHLLWGQPEGGWGQDINCGEDSGGKYDDDGLSTTNGTVCYTSLERPGYGILYASAGSAAL